VSINELALLIRELVGSSSTIRYIPPPEDDPAVRQPDITLARQSLGWEPAVDLTDGLQRTIRWFRESLDRTASSHAV
jgi:dTDP-glucose 4,6-dehydratase